MRSVARAATTSTPDSPHRNIIENVHNDGLGGVENRDGGGAEEDDVDVVVHPTATATATERGGTCRMPRGGRRRRPTVTTGPGHDRDDDPPVVAGESRPASSATVATKAGTRRVAAAAVPRLLVLLATAAAALVLLAAAAPSVSASASPPPAVPAASRPPPPGAVILPDDDENGEDAAAGGGASSSSRSSSSDDDDGWRESLPDVLRGRRTLHRLEVGGCEVYLLGTAHVSRTSCDDVGELMRHLRPDCLFLELCPQRIAILSPTPAPEEPAGSSPSLLDSVRNLQRTQGMSRTSAASAALLTKIQSDYADKLGVTIGEEFREAFRHASEQTAAANRLQPPPHHNNVANSPWLGPTPPPSQLEYASMSQPCRVVLGDRPVRITLTRAWESLSLWGKTKLVAALLWSSIRSPDAKELEEFFDSILNDGNSTDLLTKSIEELKGSFPTIGRTVIDERDRYMHAKLRQAVRTFGARRMVAVVGAGHCPGIRRLAGDGDGDGGAAEGSGPIASGGCGGHDDDPASVLAGLVETRRCKVNLVVGDDGSSGDRGAAMGASDELRSLTTDVIELHANMD